MTRLKPCKKGHDVRLSHWQSNRYWRCRECAKIVTRRFMQTEKGKALQRRMNQSAKGRARRQRYKQSPKGRLLHKKNKTAYRSSMGGRARHRLSTKIRHRAIRAGLPTTAEKAQRLDCLEQFLQLTW